MFMMLVQAEIVGCNKMSGTVFAHFHLCSRNSLFVDSQNVALVTVRTAPPSGMPSSVEHKR